MTLLTARVERRALRKVAAVLVENSAMLEHVRSSGQQRVIKTPTGVNTALFYPPVAGWRREGYLLSVCRLNDARKGLERMIRAYANMLQFDDSVPPLVLAGRGQLPAGLLGLLTNLGLSSRVTVRSDVDHAELAELYRGASVFLQTSYEEGLGMSVLEAMACGLPVVCTDTAGTRETVVNGVTGWLVRQDADSQVSGLVAGRVLEVLRGDGVGMGGRARQRCEKSFSNEVAFRPFMDVYEDLLLGREA
jgi:glycosyltransferase involved in cell wall biosynthesis